MRRTLPIAILMSLMLAGALDAAPRLAAAPHFHAPTPTQWFWRGHWSDRIHGPAFHYPAGWAARRWVVGAVLPSIFLTNLYFYDDWAALGLPPPPPGCRWVRVGSDLLLVDIATGKILDVAYGVFL